MSSRWYVKLPDQEIGPVSREELMRLASSGQFGPDHRVRKEGSTLWIPAKRVVGLFPNVAVQDCHPDASTLEAPVAPSRKRRREWPRLRFRLSGPRLMWLLGITAAVPLVAIGFWSSQVAFTPRFPEPRIYGPAFATQLNQHSALRWSALELALIYIGIPFAVAILAVVGIGWRKRRRVRR